MSIEFVEKYIDKSLNWQYLTTKKFISIDFIKQHIDKNWDFIYLYNSEKIDLEFIYQNPDHSWPWHKISSNCKLKPKFVKQHLDKDWNFKLLIDNGILSYSDFSVDFMIKKYYEYEDQYYLYEGKEDTKLDIAKFLLSMDKESLEHILKTKSVWSEFGLSSNPNINPDVLDKFIDYVDPTLLIRNTFNAKQRLVRRRQRIVAYKILSNFLNGDLLRYLILQFI